MVWTAYSFEAKGIQGYISQGGRLRDITAASSVVHALCADATVATLGQTNVPVGGLLDDALTAAGLRVGAAAFVRRAAGAFSIVLEGGSKTEELQQFRQLWSLVVANAAPGLETADAIATGQSARAALGSANASLRAARSRRAVDLPKAPPFALRTPRTGAPAVGTRRVPATNEFEPIDAPLARKHLAAGAITPARLCAPHAPASEWPFDFDRDFPFRGENRTIGIIHADGNRMGGLVRGLAERLKSQPDHEYLRYMRTFSGAVGEATVAAVQAATAAHLAPEEIFLPGKQAAWKRPARPILIGGDDVSLIVRADKALPFAETFLTVFQDEAAERLRGALGKIADGLPRLSACAGVAFINVHQPFADAHHLAESLCRHAKRSAKAAATANSLDIVPCAIAFHRVTSAMIDDYDTVLEEQFQAGDAVFAMQPYLAGPELGGLPSLGILRKLSMSLSQGELSRGPARRLMSLAYESKAEAENGYQRWRTVLEGRDKGALEAFDSLLRPLTGSTEGGPAPLFDKAGRTPLGDALALMAAERA